MKLNEFFARLPRPSAEQMEESQSRILDRLHWEAGDAPLDLKLESGTAYVPARRRTRLLPAAVAATFILALVIPWTVSRYRNLDRETRATVESGDGSLLAGQRIRYGEAIRATGSAGAVLTLGDHSHIELRTGSEIALEAAADGVRIRLNRGSVIVTAAKQRTGHLYVQTRDCTVSVVGTVFLVTADDFGSRVAVIQGEVHVQNGTTRRALLPGEQIATASSMTPQPVSEEISWSRDAAAHLMLLQQAIATPLDVSAPASGGEKAEPSPEKPTSISPTVAVKDIIGGSTAPPPSEPAAPAAPVSADLLPVRPRQVVPPAAPANRDQSTIKVDVEMVQVYTTVTDEKGRFVTNLKPNHFKVSEDGKEQQVEAFSADDSPLSIGILFDVGGIMGDNLAVAKESALSFLRAGNFRNEYFVMEFNNKPRIVEDFTSDISVLKNHAPELRRNRDDGAIDAIYAALDKLRGAKNPRKVLLIFTAGGALKSQHKASQVRNLASELDVQIYGITIVDNESHAYLEDTSGMEVIDSVGGEAFVPDTGPDFVTTSRKIAVALRNQYIMGYRSTNPVHDGKYRHVKVKFELPGAPDLFVHTRGGYYALGPEK